MAGNSHLAREAVSHGQEVGLLPRGEADSQEPQSLLPGHDEPLPPPGTFSEAGCHSARSPLFLFRLFPTLLEEFMVGQSPT